MFKRFTANPKNETNDCAIRSFANAEGKEWKEVAKEFFNIALENFLMPNDLFVASEYAVKNNYEEGYIYPDNPFTVARFAQVNPTGKFVVLVGDDEGGHAVSIIDGDYYDLVDSANCLINQYWKIA